MAAPARAAARGRANPESDPRFKRVIDKLGADSRTLKRHPPAAKKANEPAGAAKGPANEKAAGARVKQVDKLEGAETPKPETASFLEILQAEIAKAMPKTLGDTEKFMKGGSSGELKSSLKGNVAEQKQEATGDLQKTSNEAPSEAGVPAKPVTPIAPEPGTATPVVKGGEAMPAPKPDAEVSLQASKGDVQADLDKEKLTDDRLKKANDPRFSAVLTAKDAVGKQADAGPAQYRAKEAGTLAQSAAKAIDVAKKGAAVLVGVKGGNKSKILSRQEQQKAKEELELKGFSDFCVTTFERAKQAVDKRLEQLETKVNALFDRGIESALAAMKSYVEDQLQTYKLRRYLLRPFGLALWIKDQFLDLPDEVNRFYEAGRAQFTRTMNALAVQVATLVESQLAAAKNEVKTAQAQIAAKAATLSPGVKARAAQVQAEFAGKFAELESSIDDKKQQLAEGLAQKYKEAFDKADEALKAIQDENKGLVTKAKEKIGEVIKALLEFKERLMAILRKGADTLDLILKDPGQFLSNLIAAIKLGFQRFVGNIWEHLKRGFAKWLFGALSGAGIEIPSDLTLPSILKLVLGVLGITYERMRAKAVKLLGPTAVAIIEKVVEYVRALISGGPAALWEKVKEDLSNLKQMVIDAIQDWLITTIIKQAVAKVVSMFNPVGAIVQIILMIINVVRFVVERAAQIMEFVESVVNSIAAIASGAIGGAASWIERSLGNMVPILIGFLASLLGLGGISQKIKEFITKVQAKVDAAIDKAIAKIVALVKKLFGRDKPASPAEAQKRLDDAIAAAKAALSRFAGKRVGAIVLKPILAAIRIRYRLTALEPVKKGEDWFIHAEVNPTKEENSGAKADSPEAKALLKSAKSLAADVKKAASNGAKAFASGVARESARRAATASRPGSLPTKREGEESGPGLDMAALLREPGQDVLEIDVLEIAEVKAGRSPRTLKRRARSRRPPEGRPQIQVPPGRGQATVLVSADPDVARRVGRGEAVLVQDGRLVQNQLSAITENLRSGIDKMLALMREAVASGKLDADAVTRVQNILNGEGGVIRLVVDIEKGASMSDDQIAAAQALIKVAFDKLMEDAEGVETKLEFELRKQN